MDPFLEIIIIFFISVIIGSAISSYLINKEIDGAFEKIKTSIKQVGVKALAIFAVFNLFDTGSDDVSDSSDTKSSDQKND